jgi:hypothetical protein
MGASLISPQRGDERGAEPPFAAKRRAKPAEQARRCERVPWQQLPNLPNKPAVLSGFRGSGVPNTTSKPAGVGRFYDLSGVCWAMSNLASSPTPSSSQSRYVE